MYTTIDALQVSEQFELFKKGILLIYIVYVSVCTLSVPPNSFIVQQTGLQLTVGIPLAVECIPGYRLNGSESNEIVNTTIQCNENGTFDKTPTCEPKGI